MPLMRLGKMLMRNCVQQQAEALAKLLAQLREPYRTMVILVACTGLRVGELLALRWKVVDLTVGTIRVCESVFHGQAQMPKSERSIRTIPIGPQARALLEEHRKRFVPKWNEEGHAVGSLGSHGCKNSAWSQQ